MRIVTVSGTCSEVGKTTLVCELLARLPGWAAIKVTRGHYRSCGRDPDTCCVSGLLGDEPRVFSDRADTDVAAKDTGRYWAAGAADVRWVVVARGQEGEGIALALAELGDHPGVVIEGNRVVESLDPDLAVMVALPGQKEIKVSARRIVGRMHGLYVPEWNGVADRDPAFLVGAPGAWERPVWGPDDLDRLAAGLCRDPAPASTQAGG
ncbi:MAG TPA: hypothetical protein VFH11_09045 [Gemmatimonadota bacterium]|nr:hypothetical protein [Gemmatimonadota bacterium]